MSVVREKAGFKCRGLALVAVLWMIAALSIIVTGMVGTARNEVRLSAVSRQVAVATGLGQAAIHLVLQDMAAKTERANRLTYEVITYQNLPIRVQILPLNGLIDINKAPVELLSALFSVAGRLAAPDAARLAQAVVEGRLVAGAGVSNRGYEAIEDLLRVQGLGYTLYANISSLITVDARGSGRVNPLAAPENVLLVLADGNQERAAKVASDRDAGLAGVDTVTTLNGAFVENNASIRRYRIQARVPLPDGNWLLSSRFVDFGAGAATRNGLPWLTFHTDSRLDSSSGKSN